MAARLTRQEILEALTEKGVNYPSSATIAQLRTLYEQEISAGRMSMSVKDTEDILPALGAASMCPGAKASAPTSIESTLHNTKNAATVPPAAPKPHSEIPADEITLDALMLPAATVPADEAKSIENPAEQMPYVTEGSGDMLSSESMPADNQSYNKISAYANTPLLNFLALSSEVSTMPQPTAAVRTDAIGYLSKVTTPTKFYADPVVHSAASSQKTNAVPSANMDDPLEAELKTLQLRLQILRAQEEIRTIEANTNGQRRHIDLGEIDAVVPPFSGDDHYDVIKWFTQFEDYTEMCGYSDRERCLGLRRRLLGTAKNFVFNLGPIEYSQLKSRLIKVFRRTVTRQEVYRQLQARKLLPTESSLSYVIAMQTIANQSTIEEQELVDLIIDGIPESGSHITFLYGASTMEELIRRLDRFEQRRRHTALTSKRLGADTKISSSIKMNPAVQQGVAKTAEDAIRCYNCSQYGHYQSKCPKPIRPPNSCFYCGVVGHYRQNCPKRSRSLAAVVGDDEDKADPVDAFQMSG
ncbi:uncharacterized protein LOC135957113 isoform X2 [Calliphora vicina]|uniref:uncharacterized protein LOC135957113 isoform X2 n=1 Tax=Calliphora vicina TaxID=7373 RepID=UPI00325A97B0